MTDWIGETQGSTPFGTRMPPSPTCDRSNQFVPRRMRCVLDALLVVVMGAVVYCAEPLILDRAVAATPRPQQTATNDTLPRGAAEMRETILLAVRSGRIDDMRTALELNEMRPDVSDAPVDDIIAYWRGLSKDGSGREILDALGAGPSAIPDS